MKIKILMLLLVVLNFSQAQESYRYVVDALRSDSVNVYTMKKNTDKLTKKETPMVNGSVAFKLANGEKVTIDAKDTLLAWQLVELRKEHFKGVLFAVITYNGKRYFIEASALKFDENPEGVKDFINVKSKHHTKLGHLFNTTSTFYVVFILLVASIVCAYLIAVFPRFWPLVIASPLFLFAAVALEMLGLFYLGYDLLWWLDSDVYGLAAVFWRLVLFLIAIAIQFGGMFLFRKAIRTHNSQELIVWRPVIFAGLSFVALIISGLLVGNKVASSETMTYIEVPVVLLLLIIGLATSIVHNCKCLGKIAGVAFSLFAVIWSMAAISCVALFVVAFLTAFMEVICVVIAVLFITRLPPNFFTSVIPPIFFDKLGGAHYNAGERDSANFKIDQARKDD